MSASAISILWDQIQYDFVLTKPQRTKVNKQIYIGYFPLCAPAGLTIHEEYCLKIIDVHFQDEKSLPQSREYYDLVSFKGPHLRQILAMNEAARSVQDQLKTTGICKSTPGCMIVEPVYHSLEGLICDRKSATVYERLEVIYQSTLASKELSHPQNNLGSRRVCSHRDVKFLNSMIIKRKHSFVVKLIDFASIRLEDESRDTSKESVQAFLENSQGFRPGMNQRFTLQFPMSPSNTAPEDVDPSRFPVSEKTDVYALGMMLGSLFSHCLGCEEPEPSSVWYRLHKPEDPAFLADAFAEAFDQAYALDRSYERCFNSTWLECELAKHNCPLIWDDLGNAELLAHIRTIFFHATRIDPNQRMSRDELLQALSQLIDRTEHTISGTTHLYSMQDVTPCLFDCRSLNRWSDVYSKAAARQTAQCGTGHLLQQVYFGRMRHPSDDLGRLVICCDPSKEVNVPALAPFESGHGASSLPLALYKIYTFFMDHAKEYTFSGEIHIFTPDMPSPSDMALLQIDGTNYSCYDIVREYLSRLNTESAFHICVHSPERPREYADWYSWIPLEDPGVKPPRSTPAGSIHDHSGFSGVFFLDEQGSKFYPLKRKEGS